MMIRKRFRSVASKERERDGKTMLNWVRKSSPTTVHYGTNGKLSRKKRRTMHLYKKRKERLQL
jgi:hypothetical protein